MKKQLPIMLSLVLVLSIMLTGCGASGEPSEPAVSTPSDEEDNDIPNAGTSVLVAYFGNNGPFVMHLEDNATAAAIAGYVGTAEWNLPVYSYDESDVMEYYDIPSRYEIPDDSVQVTEAHAGDVFYSDPNRIILYYHDAPIDEAYTKIGTFDATEEFVSAVENNPVLEGWGNQIISIRAGE